MKKIFRTISLFCGAGGLDIGFSRAGFRTIWANDFDPDACETFRKWSGAEVVCGDIGTIDVSEIPQADIILGGFPCQGFSLSGPRKIDDSRNKLYRHYVRIVKAKQPLMFVGENVKGLLTMGDGSIMEAIVQEFSDCGYDVYYKLLNAKDYEVPEDRERVIIVGFRKDLEIVDFAFPKPAGRMITLWEALANIPYNPDEVIQAPYSSRYMSRNRKRNWDEVSYTIPAMAKQVALHPSSPDMVKIGTDEWHFGTNGQTRRFSWREAAAIQTFPNDLEFAGNLTSIYKQIGNAVPCKLAETIGKHLYEVLTTRGKEMPATNTINGKSFEYACLQSIKQAIEQDGHEVNVRISAAYETAKKAYENQSNPMKNNLCQAADTAARLLLPLEPKLEHGDGTLLLEINSDAAGIEGDVRDIVCVRNNNGWEIGISCKHNHEALKHPRITQDKDFGADWIGIPCSDDFMQEISPVIEPLVSFGASGILWRNLQNKAENYYLPILEAYRKEIIRLCEQYEEAPARLLAYFFGSRDFYKVIAHDKQKTTTIEGYNMNGTLGSSCGQIRPMMRISTLHMPTRLIEAVIKPKSKTTIILTFDGGWTVSMRLHNKDDIAKPTSLAWDVQLVGLPTGTYTSTRAWIE